MSKCYATLVFLLHLLPLFGGVNDNGDYQAWVHESLRVKLTDKTRLYVENENRWADQISFLHFTYAQVRFGIDLCKSLELAFGYRQQWVNIKGVWRARYDPLADLILKKSWGEWRSMNRVRLQYFFREEARNLWLVRDLQIFILKMEHLSPFAANECFFLETRGFFENRTFFGATIPISQKVNVSLYYMLRFIKPDTWRDTRVLGMVLLLGY